jgi:isoleucyl-tRNA synthetase
LYESTLTLLKLVTPYIPHTTHEAYLHLPYRKFDNMYLENMPEALDLGSEGLLEKYDKFMTIRDNVLKALEEARNRQVIGKSFNAKLTLYPKGETKELLNNLKANLGQIFIVSKFEMAEGVGQYKFNELTIDVEKAEGETCDRCWQVVDHTEEGLCPRCEEVLK